MHSSTITAFLLPLLLSSVLAVPTPVQNEAATQSSPSAAQISIANGLQESGHPPESLWAKAGSPGRKRSIIGVQAAPAESPEAADPTAGISPEEQDLDQQAENAEYAQATGQDPQDHPENADMTATEPSFGENLSARST